MVLVEEAQEHGASGDGEPKHDRSLRKMCIFGSPVICCIFITTMSGQADTRPTSLEAMGRKAC